KPSAANGGSEDPAILLVEKKGGSCWRLSHMKQLNYEDTLALTGNDNIIGNPVLEVNYSDKPVTDADLKSLTLLKHLRRLRLDLLETPVTDEGLKTISSLQHLQDLGLGGTNVTDAGLKSLAPLKRLRHLGLGRTKITDSGMRHLAILSHLNRLDLQDTKVTDA